MDVLRELWVVKGQSAGQIGSALSLSRNAVIGKIHRMGLINHKPKRPKQPQPSRVRTSPKLPTEEPPPVDECGEPPPPFLALAILRVRPDQCHYPHGDFVPYFFCGQPVEQNRSYCPYHQRICAPPMQRRPSVQAWPWRNA